MELLIFKLVIDKGMQSSGVARRLHHRSRIPASHFVFLQENLKTLGIDILKNTLNESTLTTL